MARYRRYKTKLSKDTTLIILAILFAPLTIAILCCYLIYLIIKTIVKKQKSKKQEISNNNYTSNNYQNKNYNFNNTDYRKKWSKDYQCADGHYVRSLSEQSIDNWLYNNGYQHSYEKSVYMKTKPDAVVLSDFYLPQEDIYIEFWGIENDEQYEKRKQEKIKLYNENNLNRIDLTKEDIKRLDDIMPRLISKFIKTKEISNDNN